jgi:glycosyltransferase involved in cell wall biosynthesis
MKINYTLWHLGPSGGIRVLLKFAEGLAQKGHMVTVSSIFGRNCYPTKAVAFRQTNVPKSYKYLSYPFLRYGFHQISQTFLKQIIPHCDINVATLSLTSFPVHNSGKGIYFYHMQHYEPISMIGIMNKRLAEKSYSLPLYKIANSIWLANMIDWKFGESPVVVNPGIDHVTFHPYDVSKTEDSFRIVCFGTTLKWKGITDLFDALKIVKKTMPKIKLLMYGSKPDALSGSPIPAEYVYKPSDEGLAMLYSSADLVVCPSWYESFPLPPLEAMACGAPVVTTRIGTEDYAFDGKNSLVVPPRNVKCLATAITRLLSDESLRESFKKEGIKTASDFTWYNSVNRIENIFNKAIKQS